MTQLRRIKLQGVIDSNNSTATPLGIDGIWTGSATETLDYGIIYISVHTDVESAVDGLEIQQSIDGIDWHFVDYYTILANASKTFSINPHARYFRLKYTNGGTGQTHFEIQTILKSNGKSSSHRIQDGIKDDDDAELVKSVLTGENPEGEFINFQATTQGNFKIAVQEYGDTASIDPFDRLRISSPYTLFDSKQLHDKQPLFWDESIGGSATSVHSSTNASTRMTVTASASDFVIRQTKQRFNYQPGKGQLILLTYHGTPVSGLTKRIGIFDGTGANNLTPNNGIFFEADGTVSWNIAKNGTITETVAQSSWNYDKLDGTGITKITLDPSAPQILVIDFEWLGVGRVRVGFVIDGIIRYCHYFNHANIASFSSVYMSTPNLPIRYTIESDGVGAGYLDHICSTVISEGGQEQNGILRSVTTSTPLSATVSGTTYALLGIRLKSVYKDITVYPEFFDTMTTSTDTSYGWSIQLNPTVAGTFTYNDVTNSAVQYAVGATANTVSPSGLIIDSGYVTSSFRSSSGANRKLITSLRMGSTIAGVMDEMVLCVTPIDVTAVIYGSLTFRELL